MKFVALISGGKDSTYNIMCCQKAGHELVCLANLYPKNVCELDSYMYQSVGSEAIPTIAKAYELPLYRQEIIGQPKSLNMSYSYVEGDEVEDLFTLLKVVLENHSDVKGVSVGAINSSYQKKRVENVCERLNLTPLCYLWEMNQLELFDRMIEADIDAVIIKVAAIGLSTKHLGLTLKQIREHMLEMHKKYDLHICGEGGEYETFVRDCPLYRSRIDINKDDTETIIHSNDDLAPVAYLKLNKISLIKKL